MEYRLYRWIGKYSSEYVTDQHCEVLIYATSIEQARKTYNKRTLPQFDELVASNNYIEDDSPALRVLLHYQYKGHHYFYVPTITVLYLDETYKKPKINIAELFD